MGTTNNGNGNGTTPDYSGGPNGNPYTGSSTWEEGDVLAGCVCHLSDDGKCPACDDDCIRSRTMQHHRKERVHSHRPERVHLAFQHTPRQERTHYANAQWSVGTLGYVPPTTEAPLVDDVFRAPEYDASGQRNWSRMVATGFIGKARSQGIPYNDALLDLANDVAQEAGLLILRGYSPTSARWIAVRQRLVVGFERTRVNRQYTPEQLAKMAPKHRKSAVAKMARMERSGISGPGCYIRRMPLEDQLVDRFKLESVLHGREVQDLLAVVMEEPHNTKQGKVLRKRFIRTVFGDRTRSAKDRHSAKAMMRSAKRLLSSTDKTCINAEIDAKYQGVFGEKPYRLFVRKCKCPAGIPSTPAEGNDVFRTYADGDHTVVNFKPITGGLSTVERFDLHAKDRNSGIELPTRESVLAMYQHYEPGIQYKERTATPEFAGSAYDATTGAAVPTGPTYASFGNRMASKPGRKPMQFANGITLPRAGLKARRAYPVEPETAEQRFATVERECFALTGISGWDY